MTDARVLRSDHAPTPFTAAQIRSGCPEGRTVTSVTETLEGESATETVRFTGCDESGAFLGSEKAGRRVSWADLQAHASFPAADTTITPETIETPLGSLDTSRYEVSRGNETHFFWFDLDRPGMPVRQAIVVDGLEISRTTVVADEVT